MALVGLVHRSVGVTAEYMALGPVPAGLVVRGLWLLIAADSAQTPIIGVGLSEGGEESEGNFLASAPLIRSDIAAGISVGGFSAFIFRMLSNTTFEMTLPLYVPVLWGPAWVILQLILTALSSRVTAGLVLEPERLVRLSEDRMREPKAVWDGSRVMDDLRAAGEAARA